MLQIIPVGGYSEVGKNMTLVRVDDEAVILDMGLHMPNYISLTEDEDIRFLSPDQLREAEAVPDDSIVAGYKDEVKAIIPSHAHLDHVGAIPFLSDSYKCQIVCAPFTACVLNSILHSERIKLKNPITVLEENSRLKLSKKIIVEFINATHSTPQSVMIALHTPYGVILYANEFKFDDEPTLGKKPNYKRLEQLGKENVVALITDTLYVHEAMKMPGEKVVRQMLKEVLLYQNTENKAIVITTFSSHLARLKSIVEYCKKLKRKVVFMGRNLAKYTLAAKDAGIIDLTKDAEIVQYPKQVKRWLKAIGKEGTEKYALVVTGHQGEPRATLSKMALGELPFSFKKGDVVVFSCKTIPVEPNIQHRERLDKVLMEQGVQIYKDIHYSGHGAREDIRKLIQLVKPKHLVPTHSEKGAMLSFRELALEMDYKKAAVHLLENGQVLELE